MIEVRPERPGDQEAVRRVNEAAFGRPDEAALVERLRAQAPLYLALVATLDASVVGHVAFTPVTLEPAKPGLTLLGLGPMAVVPAQQGRGIGSTLVYEGLAACRRAGAQAVVVLGHSKYYPRFGFRPAVTFGLNSEYDVPLEVFMALPLVPGALEGVEGLVHYHPAFQN